MRLKIGLPKGSLEQATRALFEKAGFSIVSDDRSYFPTVDDPELEPLLIRAQEVSRYVESGVLDAGVTGNDWILESGSRAVEVAELRYSKEGTTPVRWVLAVPKGSKVRSVKDLQGKHIATELVSVTRKYLKKNKVEAQVEFSWGATEVKPPHLADAIVELTETGGSLAANNLRIVDEVLGHDQTTPRLIANRDSWKDAWKRSKLENLALLLKGALTARGMVGLKMNVSSRNLEKVLKLLPALKNPTVSRLSDEAWVAVETVMEEKVVRDIIPRLKKAGAEGIIEYPLNKVVP